MAEVESVRVVLRVRPLSEKEVVANHRIALHQVTHLTQLGSLATQIFFFSWAHTPNHKTTPACTRLHYLSQHNDIFLYAHALSQLFMATHKVKSTTDACSD